MAKGGGTGGDARDGGLEVHLVLVGLAPGTARALTAAAAARAGSAIDAVADVPAASGVMPRGKAQVVLLADRLASRDAVGRLRGPARQVPVIAVGQASPLAVMQALEIGASGYLPSAEAVTRLHEAVDRVASGGTFLPSPGQGTARAAAVRGGSTPRDPAALRKLSARQVEVLRLVARGEGNGSVAEALGIGVATVKAHLTAAYRILGVKSRTQAALWFRRLGASPG